MSDTIDEKLSFGELQDEIRAQKITQFNLNVDATARAEENVIYFFVPGVSVRLYRDGHYDMIADCEGE